MATIYSFGEWIKLRRTHLRFTQRAIAEQVFCSTAMIKKIEADERQPSPELAELLAQALQVPPAYRPIFLACARGDRPVDTLPPGFATEALVAEAGGQAPNSSLLPLSTTPFVGRTAELAEAGALLANPACRLLTLVGPGGIGKTRLAIELARATQQVSAGSVVFVALASVTDAAQLPAAIAHTLEIPLSGPSAPQVLRVLQRRTLLLVLDNCEQLEGDLAWLSDVVAKAAGVKVLATARGRLQLAEEWIYPVRGLPEAAELFAQTAVRVNPTFDPTMQADAIARICQLVEGLPLALELAAGWTPYLECVAIAEHIRQGIDILATNVRNVPERHRSMRAVFDHSWALLTATEQEALMRLSVFRGGWLVAEAEVVADAHLLVLRTLAEKSWIWANERGRYDMHEFVRSYATAQLRAAGCEAETRQRHADAYWSMVEKMTSVFFNLSATVFERLDQEQDNCRAALQWWMESGQASAALPMVEALGQYWYWRGYREEGTFWISTVLGAVSPQDSVLLGQVLFHLSALLSRLGRTDEAIACFQRAMGMARRLEAPELLIPLLAVGSQFMPSRRQAQAALDEVIAMHEALDETRQVSFIAAAYGLYGDLMREMGRYAEARPYYEKSLAIQRRSGASPFFSALPAGNLGRLALQAGQLDEAYGLIAETVAQVRKHRNYKGLAEWLVRLGEVETYMARYDAAAAHLHECLQLFIDMSEPRAQADVQAGLAYLALRTQSLDDAELSIRQSLEIYRTLYEQAEQAHFGERFVSPEFVDALLRAGLVAAAREQYELAATFFGAVLHLSQRIKHTPAPPLQQPLNAALADTRQQLGAKFQETLDVGSGLPLEVVLALFVNPHYGRP